MPSTTGEFYIRGCSFLSANESHLWFTHSGIILGLLCELAIAIPLLLSLPLVLETMARGDLAFRIHLQVGCANRMLYAQFVL